MTTAIEYALMAGASYISTRDDINQFPVPGGWVENVNKRQALPSGFEATYFTSGTNIVISYAGTDPGDITGDIAADLALAAGTLSDQLKQAADYYLQVKALNANAVISFTGHSLGGGLASLMAVMFGESAYTFDQAPFLNSAKTFTTTDPATGNTIPRSVAIDLRTYLANHAPVSALAKLDAFIAASDPFNANPNPADTLATRSGQVTNINTQGEFLSSWFGVPSSNRIGSQADVLNGNAGVSGLDLHSQALLTAFLQSRQTAATGQALNDVTFKLPDLLKMVFDKNLFVYPTDKNNDKNVNLIERLVQHQAGVRDPATGSTTTPADAMLDRLTRDLWKLAQDGGLTLHDNNPSNADLNEVSKALTAFAMQFYYQDTPNAIDSAKELYNAIGGGLQFDLADVLPAVKTALDSGQSADLNAAKGYAQYFKYYLGSTNNFSVEEQALIKSLLPNLRDWFVQAGTGGMTATDTLNRGDFMLGGIGADTLTGGDKTDLLVGNAGNDTLKGGKGNDTLIGGTGFDTYLVNLGDGLDTVLDRDGAGVIQLGSVDAKGSAGLTDPTKWMQLGTDTWVDSQNGVVYSKSIVDGATQLLVHQGNNNVLVKSLADNAFGIVLGAGVTPVVTPPVATLAGDFKKAIDTHGTPETGDDTYVMTNGNYTADGDEANALDLISGTAGNDAIAGLGGDDALSGMAGDDHIEGGPGGDAIQGGLGKDTLNGGAGDDIIYGSSDMAIDKPTSINFIYPVNTYLYPQATGFNWTTGYNATLANGVPHIYSSAPRNRLDGDQGNRIDGGAGNDFIAAGTGADYAQGGADKDWIWGMDQDDILFGDGDNDLIHGDGDQPGGNSVVWALPGNHGNDIIDGGDGDDILYGQGKDSILGNPDADYLHEIGSSYALAGGVYLSGEVGNDNEWRIAA